MSPNLVCAKRRTLAIALGICLLTSACVTEGTAYAASDAEAMDKLLRLMQRRLQIAHDVARNKWNRSAPIEDLEREQAVIDAATRQAARRGMDAPRIGVFFQMQITAGKIIQASLFEQWKAARLERSVDAPDLAAGLRSELDRLTVELLAAFEQATPALGRQGARQLLWQRAANFTSDLAGFKPAWLLAVDCLAATP
jgi:chorismate mutase-like protein